MQEIASGGERALSNFGPDAQIEKTAAGRAIKGGSRISETMGPVERTRQLDMNPDVGNLTRPIPSQGQDIAGREMETYQGQDADPGRGTGIYGYEKSYTAGAIDRSTGDFTAAAEKQPSLVMKKVRAWHRGYVLPPSG